MNFTDLCFWIIVVIIVAFVVELIVIPKFFCKKCTSKVCLVGKTALVTGGSQGIGYEIVLGLAQRGCRVIIADKIINNEIKNKIMLETNNPEIYLEFVDLASFYSVRALAEKLNRREKKLDILIHNAGIGQCGDAMSDDGLNLTMQVNYYSPFLLTHLLVDLMKSADGARLIFCSSAIVTANLFTFGLRLQKSIEEYKQSKFFLIVAADIFAEKLKSYNITSNSFHPGVVNTQIHKQFFKNNFMQYLFAPFAFYVLKTPEDGAQTAIYLACSNEVKNVTSKFFADLLPISKPKDLKNQNLCKTIWKGSERAVKLKTDELL